MKKIVIGFAALSAVFCLAAFRTADPSSLSIGAKAPKADLKMKNIDGKMLSIGEIASKNGVLVIFSCNTCPFVIGAEGYGEGWEGRYDDLAEACKKNGVGMVLVNSNEAKRDKGDALADMKTRAESKKFSHVPYVLDTNSELANAFGARTTPHVFLFDKDLKLVYKGAIDDSNESLAKVKEPWLGNALTNLASGKTISPAETKPVGCGIKRVQ